MKPSIQVEHLSKKYLISHETQNPHASLKENITESAKHFFRRLFGHSQGSLNTSTEDFLALQDLTLDIDEGDRVAILGRNGAGKSTFLKLLSRITEPSSGRIKIRGRVASLLEVGTGFHPDLTGRENIFLNGAILGISYREIKQKFDEIVAFADVEQFLDTPIKRFSSGMFMRLGFAVAAHLDADVLIVDEVLAVGDMQFQEKCLKKMNEIGNSGRTILFVSHHVPSVLSLCTKGIFLEKGRLVSYEPIESCLSRYINSCPVAGLQWQGSLGDEHVRFYRASLKAPLSSESFFVRGEKTHLELDMEILKPHPELVLGFSVLNSHNQLIASSRLSEECMHVGQVAGNHRLAFDLDLDLFHPGEYQIRLESSLFNRKKIAGEVLLKFSLFNHQTTAISDKDGISLGNRWSLKSS